MTLNLKLHFDGEDAEEILNLGDSENSRKTKKKKKKREEEEENLERKLFPPFILQVSPSAGLPFPLIGLTPSCFGQPILPFKPSILEDRAILPLIQFLKIRKTKGM